MVKSFTGVRKAPEKNVAQALAVRDFMTRQLTTFKPSQSIGEVVKIMINKKISGGPVLDEAGKLVGIISEGDCLKEIVRGRYSHSPNNTGVVADHMVRDVKTIDPDTSVFDAAQLFLNSRVRRFPVLEDDKLIGQISQRDVMRAIDQLKDSTW